MEACTLKQMANKYYCDNIDRYTTMLKLYKGFLYTSVDDCIEVKPTNFTVNSFTKFRRHKNCVKDMVYISGNAPVSVSISEIVSVSSCKGGMHVENKSY